MELYNALRRTVDQKLTRKLSYLKDDRAMHGRKISRIHGYFSRNLQ